MTEELQTPEEMEIYKRVVTFKLLKSFTAFLMFFGFIVARLSGIIDWSWWWLLVIYIFS